MPADFKQDELALAVGSSAASGTAVSEAARAELEFCLSHAVDQLIRQPRGLGSMRRRAARLLVDGQDALASSMESARSGKVLGHEHHQDRQAAAAHPGQTG